MIQWSQIEWLCTSTCNIGSSWGCDIPSICSDFHSFSSWGKPLTTWRLNVETMTKVLLSQSQCWVDGHCHLIYTHHFGGILTWADSSVHIHTLPIYLYFVTPSNYPNQMPKQQHNSWWTSDMSLPSLHQRSRCLNLEYVGVLWISSWCRCCNDEWPAIYCLKNLVEAWIGRGWQAHFYSTRVIQDNDSACLDWWQLVRLRSS